MTHYIVHIYREMRLSYADIEADTPEAAANIARDKPTDEADSIDDCNGEDLSALVDLAGDEDYCHSVTIDFEQEKQRQAAPALLRALAGMLEVFVDSDQLADYEDMETVKAARDAIAVAKASGIAPADTDIHALLAKRRQIARIWSIEEVQHLRTDLDDDKAWEVLQVAEDSHEGDIGINWSVLECHAEMLFGAAPDTDEAREA